MTVGWERARRVAAEAGQAVPPRPVTDVALAAALGRTLGAPLHARGDLPPWPTSAMDGWALRGDGPWQVAGKLVARVSLSPDASTRTAMVKLRRGFQLLEYSNLQLRCRL